MVSYRPHSWLCWSSPWKDNLHRCGSRSSILSDSDDWRGHLKTAVSTPIGLFECVVIPFGLRNIKQSFQRFIVTIFRDLDFVCCYIDDIIIMSESPEQHREYQRIVLCRLQHRLSSNISHCCFDQSGVQYLGYTSERTATITIYRK
jgi:hypothetical protein